MGRSSLLYTQFKEGTKHVLSEWSRVTKPEEVFNKGMAGGEQVPVLRVVLVLDWTANIPPCYGDIRAK